MREGVMHVLQNIFKYRGFETPTRMMHGVAAHRRVADEVAALGVTKPLIVTDPGVVKAGILDRIRKVLTEAGISHGVFDQVVPNPSIYTVADAHEVYRREGCDGLIGLGGGSSIDTAKAVGVEATHEGSILDYEVGKKELTRRIAPLVAIPTTAGTGSEVTLWAVITDPEREFKFNVGGPYIGAHVAIVDPELHVSMPAWVTAGTGIDALCHAYECYTCHFAQPHTEAFALYAVELAAKYLRRAFANGKDLEARYYMAMSAHLAGLSYGTESAGAVHAMAQTLGGIYPKTHHGLVVAAMLPTVVEYNWQGDPGKHRRFAEALGINTTGMSEREAALSAVEWLRQLNEDLSIPSLKEQGVDPSDRDRLAKEAARDPQTVGNVRDIDYDGYLGLYERLLG